MIASVTGVEGAGVAVRHGADIIDVKNADGAFGAIRWRPERLSIGGRIAAHVSRTRGRLPNSAANALSNIARSVAGHAGYLKVLVELDVVLAVSAFGVIDFEIAAAPVSFSILPPVQPQASNVALIFSASAGVTGVSARSAEVLAMVPAAANAIAMCLTTAKRLMRSNVASSLWSTARLGLSGFQIGHSVRNSRQFLGRSRRGGARC